MPAKVNLLEFNPYPGSTFTRASAERLAEFRRWLREFGVFLGKGESNYHVQGGNSQLIAALARSIQGPKILSATVTRIERREENGRIIAEARAAR